MSQSLVIKHLIKASLLVLGRRIRWIHVNRISAVRRVGQPDSPDSHNSVQCDVVTCIFFLQTTWPQLRAPAVSGICHMNPEFRLGWKSRKLQVIELDDAMTLLDNLATPLFHLFLFNVLLSWYLGKLQLHVSIDTNEIQWTQMTWSNSSTKKGSQCRLLSYWIQLAKHRNFKGTDPSFTMLACWSTAVGQTL